MLSQAAYSSYLTAFYLKPSLDGVKHHENILLTQYGSEPAPIYTLHRLDPASLTSRAAYAVAIFEAHNPAVLYGEVLVKPGWTQPSLSQDEIRRNGGVAPPPQPITPDEFIIQLYNPDQQVTVKVKPGSWGGSASYEFSMPQNTFRVPSASALDRGQNDPGADATTPKVNFTWKKEGKLSKDLTCFLTGKSTDPAGKKKAKEPDIAVALFSGFKEMTVYEPNLYRVEMEDPKGLEVVIMLSSVVIKDLYLGGSKDPFNVGENPRKNSGGLLGARKGTSPTIAQGNTPPLASVPPRQNQQQPKPQAMPATGLYNQRPAAGPTNNPKGKNAQPQQPVQDPRRQWEIDAETARLKAQVEAEERERAKQDEHRRRERQKVDEAETKRLKKMVEQEQKELAKQEKEQRRRQAEVDKETERLRKQYGDQSQLFPARPARNNHPYQQQRPAVSASNLTHRPHVPQLAPIPQHRPAGNYAPAGSSRPQTRPSGSPYLMPPGSSGHASSSMIGSNGMPLKEQKRPSFWNLKGDNNSKLARKRSSMF